MGRAQNDNYEKNHFGHRLYCGDVFVCYNLQRFEIARDVSRIKEIGGLKCPNHECVRDNHQHACHGVQQASGTICI